MVGTGPQSDRVGFGEYVQKNMKLYELRNGVTLDGHATANYVRGELARFLRKSPYQVNLLIGACDEQVTPENGKVVAPSLHWIDYLGSMVKVNFGVHGYGSNFCLSIFDREWQVRFRGRLGRPGMNGSAHIQFGILQPDLSVEQATKILKMCHAELETRFLVRNGEWIYKVRKTLFLCAASVSFQLLTPYELVDCRR
jgi:20S proteasome subunit beta 4